MPAVSIGPRMSACINLLYFVPRSLPEEPWSAKKNGPCPKELGPACAVVGSGVLYQRSRHLVGCTEYFATFTESLNEGRSDRTYVFFFASAKLVPHGRIS